MSSRAEKAYRAYRKCSSVAYKKATNTMLNTIYNIECKIKKDAEYAMELEAFKTEEGDSIALLIEKYFNSYNCLFGMDIRDSLVELDDPELAIGSYFIITTYRRGVNGIPEEHAPTEFIPGESAYVRATLYSHETGEEISVPSISMRSLNDDGISTERVTKNSSSIEFTVSVSRAGAVKFRVDALGVDGNIIPGSESAFGGVLFGRDEILPTHDVPYDFDDFWLGEIDRMLTVDPTDRLASEYSGTVVTMFDITKKNRHKIVKADIEYLDMMRKNAQATLENEALISYDLWEVNLKAPGPCPATAYVCAPKSVDDKSVPISFVFDGYSVYSPEPTASPSAITVRCTHHGYELGKEVASYYKKINENVAHSYGRANGKINSSYDDPHDCYMTYLLLRDLQMVRYLSDPHLSAELDTVHKKWNGKIEISGGSMGGYQAVSISALHTLLNEKLPLSKLISISANIPAFNNMAGILDNRIPSRNSYQKEADYFDAAMFAHLVSAPITITRVGLGDEACPAGAITAMFNSLPKSVKREIRYLQNSSHGYLLDPDKQKWYNYKYGAEK